MRPAWSGGSEAHLNQRVVECPIRVELLPFAFRACFFDVFSRMWDSVDG
jgi:hypothetical protein